MNREKIKRIIDNLEKVYNLNKIEEIARKHQFIRSSKFAPLIKTPGVR
ncbi:MAG: hypothetical protein ACREVX_00395 [Clostridium sp.]